MNEKEVFNGQDARPGGVINRPAASRVRAWYDYADGDVNSLNGSLTDHSRA